MQLTKWYNAMFSKQKQNPDPQNAGQVKGCNLGPKGQNKRIKKNKLRKSGSSGASASVNN